MLTTPDFFRINQNLAEITYYQIGGIARYFAEPKSLSEVQEALLWAKKNVLPCSVLGSGSNSVYADEEFAGVVISLAKLSSWHWETKEILFVEAGVTNTEVAEICLEAGRSGAGWMYRMPGQMGATIRMNARCYGGEISQIALQVMTIDTHGVLKTYDAREIFQGYKSTTLMHKPEIVVAARLFLPQKLAAKKILKYMLECEADRQTKRHFYMPSCGSTFKNNYAVGKPSGKVFDELGLKGTKKGQAEVSAYHGNFILNMGGASAADILSLAAFMRQKAKSEAHADLELEVQPVGLFSNELYQNCGMEKLGPSYAAGNKKWMGLLWFPGNAAENKAATKLPVRVFAAPFIEYTHRFNMGVPFLAVEVIQLHSFEEAKKNPNLPFLEWRTLSTRAYEKDFRLKVPTALRKKDRFVDNLWQYSVSEIFLADFSSPENYIEVEMTPYGEWIALEFKGTRKRTARNTTPNKSLWNGLSFINKKSEYKETLSVFGASFTYAQLENIFQGDKKHLRLQCALSLGNGRYFLAPYWKESSTAQPDFHQGQKFWHVELF